MCCDLSNHHSSGSFNRHSNLCLFHSMLAVLVKCCENDKHCLCCGKLTVLTQTHKVKQQMSKEKLFSFVRHSITTTWWHKEMSMTGNFDARGCRTIFLCIHLTCISRQQYKMANQLYNPQSTICQYKVLTLCCTQLSV